MAEYGKKDVSVAERQVMILSILSENPVGYTIEELTELLNKWGANVMKRSISRDIDDLSTSYAIVEEERNNKTYYKANKFNLKNIDLTVSDMLSISFLEQLVKPYQNLTVGKNAAGIIKRIKENTGKLNKELIDNLGETFKVDGVNESDDVVSPIVESIIKSAIEKKCVVEIEYFDWKTKGVTKRKINPYSLVVIDKRISVEAFCHLKEAMRTFRLSRIKKATLLDETFRIDDNYRINENDKFIKMYGDNVQTIKLEFKGEAASFVKEYYSQIADKITDEGEKIVFVKKASITNEVIRFVLSFGSEVRVIEPVELKSEIKNSILAMYDEICGEI